MILALPFKARPEKTRLGLAKHRKPAFVFLAGNGPSIRELEVLHGRDRNMEAGTASWPVCVRTFALSLFGRTQGKTQKGFGTQGSSDTFYNGHHRNQRHYGYLAGGIREDNATMIRSNETTILMREFNDKVASAQEQARKLNEILQDLTADTCPLSPCDDCVLVRCALRRLS